MMFRSSIDAFLYAVRSGNGVRDVQASIGYMRNGIKRCTVQVSCDGGAGFGIEAYGEEADALFHEAKKYSEKERLAIA
ncbi:hypothetical protein [Nitrososphaera viennensis]|uniref:Uncharacterized protein n=2 Tax=Nitrososphaera viennensis TaxID=1034015 RepID=A0A060HRZ4_9ARCH|nr:hypothetical protein [Nitrososphaera viennensis]AIC15917.1 hypothetical protein NVIE_016640 [Nitrososphaera viennensis EN76]UVS67902.1 hypothetical protein NWT39_08295 [Nitrososphaera viennensis]